MERIEEQLRAYRPWNEQEEADCAELLRRLGQGEDRPCAHGLSQSL